MYALITFSNGDTIKLADGQYVFPIVQSNFDGKLSTSLDKPCQIWHHVSSGFIPSITEILSQCIFFQIEENGPIAYSSAAVIKIENIE